MSEQPLPLPELSPLPWAIDPDDREGMEWNVHIVERDRPYMRVCFMSNCSQAEINAAFIVKAVNNHDALVEALRPFAWYFEVNDCNDREDHGDAIEVPIRDLRAAFKLFKAMGLPVTPLGGVVGKARE